MGAEKEIQDAIDKLGRSFNEYKTVNDERFAKVEKGEYVPKDLTDKLDKISDEMSDQQALIDSLSQKVTTPANGGGDSELETAKAEHSKGFKNFMVKGQENGLRELEVNAAINTGADADGGYAVPEEIDSQIESLLIDVSPMREIATVRPVGTSDYKKLVNLHGTASGWVGETAARPETNTPQLAEVIPPMGEIYANPAITQTALEDLFFDPAAWLSDEVVLEFAEQEGAAFVNGDGTNKPRGLLNYPTAATADATRPFGTLEHVPTGAAGAFAASDPHNTLIDLVYAVKQGYRRNSRWATSKNVLREVRKMKDGDGNLIWQPGLAAGEPQTLLGYAITEMEDFPDIAADSLSMAFGDFKRAYLILDRRGTMVLRDPFTNKPYIHFYTTKRVGGGVVNSQAVKVLKFGTT